SGPAAGNLAGTAWALAVGGQAVVFDEISVAGDERFTALWAASVFPVADHAWKIAGVDVTQSGVLTDFRGPDEIFWRCVALAIILHFVVSVERGHVPGNIGRNVCQ